MRHGRRSVFGFTSKQVTKWQWFAQDRYWNWTVRVELRDVLSACPSVVLVAETDGKGSEKITLENANIVELKTACERASKDKKDLDWNSFLYVCLTGDKSKKSAAVQIEYRVLDIAEGADGIQYLREDDGIVFTRRGDNKYISVVNTEGSLEEVRLLLSDNNVNRAYIDNLLQSVQITYGGLLKLLHPDSVQKYIRKGGRLFESGFVLAEAMKIKSKKK